MGIRFSFKKRFQSVVLLLFIFSRICFSQNLEAKYWYFGLGSGIEFDNGTPLPNLNGIHNSASAVATISDAKGKLLFYADRFNIYNAQHDTMLNGANILNASNLLIVKKPLSGNEYYLFSTESYPNSDPYSGRCKYLIIDMNDDNQNGSVKFSAYLPFFVNLRGISVIDHSNDQDKWIILKSDTAEEFISVPLTPSGLDLNSIQLSYFGKFLFNAHLFMKSSPNSKYLACVNRAPKGQLEIFKANNTTGQLSNRIFSDSTGILGEALYCSFSSNSKHIFVSKRNKLIAFDVSSEDSTLIKASLLIVDSNLRINSLMGDHQLGIDGHLYFINLDPEFQKSKKLSRIKCPDDVFNKIIIEDTVIGPLGRSIGIQLPTLNQTLYVNAHKLQAQSISYSDTLCPGDSAQLVAYGASMDQFVWSPGNGLSCSNCPSPMAAPSVTTTYRVIGRATSCTVDNLDTAFVTVYVVPPANNVGVVGKHTFCLGDSMPLSVNVPFRSILWNTGSTNDTLWASSQGIYSAVLTTACYTKTINHTLVQLPEPTFSVFPKDTTVCEGQQVRFRGLSNATIHWFNGSTGDYTFARQAGTYYEYAENQCGIAIDTAVIRHSIPKASFVLDSAVGFAPFSTQALAPDSFASFLWMLNENEVGNSAQLTLSALAVDTHVLHLMAFDQLGCSDTTSQFIYVRNPVFEKLPSLVDSGNVPCAVLAYPNPFEREFTLSPKNASQPILELFISDAMGKSIFQANELVYGFPLKVAPDHQANGVYFIRYQCNGQWFEHKVVKTD